MNLSSVKKRHLLCVKSSSVILVTIREIQFSFRYSQRLCIKLIDSWIIYSNHLYEFKRRDVLVSLL